MASRDKASKSKGVTFTHDAAKAIADTVRTVQAGDRKQGGIRGSGGAYASSHYLSKTTATWTKGTKATLTLWVGDGGSEAASSGDTVDAWNKSGRDVVSGKWVLLARANGTFYLAEPEVDVIEQDVLTGVTLGSSGLVFTKETLYVIGKKTPKPADTTISTTACT